MYRRARIRLLTAAILAAVVSGCGQTNGTDGTPAAASTEENGGNGSVIDSEEPASGDGGPLARSDASPVGLPPLDCGLLEGTYGSIPCDAITDDYLLALEYCDRYGPPRVPSGYFREDEPGIWFDPCSPDLATTETRARTGGEAAAASTGGELFVRSSRQTEYFYEVVYEVTNVGANGASELNTFRTTRCDYFDGTTLGGSPHGSADALAFLASYLWWSVEGRRVGSHILRGEKSTGVDGHGFEMCHTTLVTGDFGMCDAIGLHRTDFREEPDGTVTILPVATLRTIDGECHSDSEW